MLSADSLSATPVLIRKMPVQELIVDLHLEQRGLAFSCYKSVHIWDFWKIDLLDASAAAAQTNPWHLAQGKWNRKNYLLNHFLP